MCDNFFGESQTEIEGCMEGVRNVLKVSELHKSLHGKQEVLRAWGIGSVKKE